MCGVQTPIRCENRITEQLKARPKIDSIKFQQIYGIPGLDTEFDRTNLLSVHFSSRHNNGHVTRSQFRQCLTILELHVTEAEMSALEAKYCNDVGFNYILFLGELQPQEPPKLMYLQRMEDIRIANEKMSLPETNTAKDLEGVLMKVKTKVLSC